MFTSLMISDGTKQVKQQTKHENIKVVLPFEALVTTLLSNNTILHGKLNCVQYCT